MNKKNHTGARGILRVVFSYLILGAVWIIISNRVLEFFVFDRHRMSVLQTYLGWGFVAASSLLIYLTIRRELRKRARAEEDLAASEKKYRSLIERSNDAVFIIDAETGTIQDVNSKAVEMLKLPRERLIGMHHLQIHPPDTAERCREIMDESLKKGSLISSDLCIYSSDGRSIPVEVSVTVVERDGKQYLQGFFRDITKRKEAEGLANVRLQHLGALHAIDLIISSSLDLRVTLSQVLDLVVSQLRVDAAAIMLLNANTKMLEYAAGRGFRSRSFEQSRIRMGDGIAGVAALEHRSITIMNILDTASGYVRDPLLEDEGVVSYAVVPLMAKGQVKGVLEVFHRTPWNIDAEWQSFLEALAAQAAIAIDNASLFKEVQRSSTELSLAYDATLEGWARALDLRHRATERHTERVTEMTLRLAVAMGVEEEELLQIRRGSLLHDIGKLGIPDSVLLKPGPLNKEEWDLMFRHPQYAFDLLYPIAYLRPALDIPFAHHEKWDGSGYPRGLKGEQIPLAARIFSVADVWDAMTDEHRHYRTALSKDEVREHLRTLAGTQLDPVVVDTFLKMEW